MNDNEPFGASGSPLWVEAILDRHDLWLRSDSEISAAIVLLFDVAYDLKEVAATAHQENAITPDTLCRLRSCVAKLTDTIELARLCPNEAEKGTVIESEDGTLTWTPASLVRSYEAAEDPSVPPAR